MGEARNVSWGSETGKYARPESGLFFVKSVLTLLELKELLFLVDCHLQNRTAFLGKAFLHSLLLYLLSDDLLQRLVIRRMEEKGSAYSVEALRGNLKVRMSVGCLDESDDEIGDVSAHESVLSKQCGVLFDLLVAESVRIETLL